MVVAALLSSQIILMLSIVWLARRVARLSKLASRSSNRVPDPARWESRLAELQADVLSLSSTFEKVAKQTMRLNSRAGMRELREREAPPVGTSKAELRKFYGLNTDGPEFARRQMSLVPKE